MHLVGLISVLSESATLFCKWGLDKLDKLDEVTLANAGASF